VSSSRVPHTTAVTHLTIALTSLAVLGLVRKDLGAQIEDGQRAWDSHGFASGKNGEVPARDQA